MAQGGGGSGRCEQCCAPRAGGACTSTSLTRPVSTAQVAAPTCSQRQAPPPWSLQVAAAVPLMEHRRPILGGTCTAGPHSGQLDSEARPGCIPGSHPLPTPLLQLQYATSASVRATPRPAEWSSRDRKFTAFRPRQLTAAVRLPRLGVPPTRRVGACQQCAPSFQKSAASQIRIISTCPPSRFLSNRCSNATRAAPPRLPDLPRSPRERGRAKRSVAVLGPRKHWQAAMETHAQFTGRTPAAAGGW